MGYYLDLARSKDYARIFSQVDSFVAQSQENDTIGGVNLFPYDVDPENYELWDKVGQGVGNLKSLRMLNIHLNNNLGDLDWEILARILPHIQNKIELKIIGRHNGGAEEMRAFARAIQGHPTITRFVACISFENTAKLCSALATLPSLESAVLKHQRLGREEVPTLRSPESMTEFLRAPSLRFVEFRFLCLTSSLCQAIAIALRQRSSITSLVFNQCSFPEGGGEKIASALKANATLKTFHISQFTDISTNEAFYDAMATSLKSNSALQELLIRHGDACSPTSASISSLLLALGNNKTLRKLHVYGASSAGESVIPALREGLGKNATLEILEFYHGGTRDETHLNSFHIAVVEALQQNKTLKTLRLCYGTPKLTNDQAKHLTSVIKKNYGLEIIPVLDSDDRMGDLRSILRLNGAGRGYLLEDHAGSFVSKGVGVLRAVSDDLNCVFLHLLENPSLCDRSH
jgi:hypothetical protein